MFDLERNADSIHTPWYRMCRSKAVSIQSLLLTPLLGAYVVATLQGAMILVMALAQLSEVQVFTGQVRSENPRL